MILINLKIKATNLRGVVSNAIPRNPFVIIFFISLLSCMQLKAQEKKGWQDKGEIEDTQIIIEKDRKIELPEAVRNFEKVPVQPKASLKQLQPYKFDDFELILSDIEMKMKVLTAKQDDLKKLYGNYIKLGYGSYSTPYLEGFFNNKRSEKYSYGGRVKHLSSRYGHVDQENSGNSDNEVEVFGKVFSKTAIISGNLNYNRDKYYFYGYPRNISETPRKGDIDHIMSTIGANFQVDNNDKDAVLDYHVGFNASKFTDNYNAKENEAGFRVKGSYNLTSASQIIGNMELYITKREDSAAVNRSFFKLSPHYVFDLKGFHLKLGGNIVYQNDTVNATKFNIFPSAEASYKIIPEVTAYAGVEGDVYRTSLKKFSGENPYLESNVQLLHTKKLLDFYGGFRGKVLTNLAYNLKVSVADYKNLYFFQNSQKDQSKFEIVYDNNTTIFSYLAELSYNYSEKVNLGLKLEGFGYTLGNLDQHWHRPNYTATFVGNYIIKEKIFLTSELFYVNGLIAKNFTTNDVTELDDIVDLNLKTDYKFSPKFSAFIHANNILSKNYQRFLYYPSRGFNILAGVTFSF